MSWISDQRSGRKTILGTDSDEQLGDACGWRWEDRTEGDFCRSMSRTKPWKYCFLLVKATRHGQVGNAPTSVLYYVWLHRSIRIRVTSLTVSWQSTVGLLVSYYLMFQIWCWPASFFCVGLGRWRTNKPFGTDDGANRCAIHRPIRNRSMNILMFEGGAYFETLTHKRTPNCLPTTFALSSDCLRSVI
jgi:hypothetical protein